MAATEGEPERWMKPAIILIFAIAIGPAFTTLLLEYGDDALEAARSILDYYANSNWDLSRVLANQ